MTERRFRLIPGLVLLYPAASAGVRLRVGCLVFESVTNVCLSSPSLRLFSPLDGVHGRDTFAILGAAVSAAGTVLVFLRMAGFRCRP